MSKINIITASIVVYKEQISSLQRTIDSVISSELVKTLYIIDNSPTNKLGGFINHPKIDYIFSGKNLGFGKGHNHILHLLKKKKSEFHLILNPDVQFDSSIFQELISRLEKQEDLAVISPKSILRNGDIQYIARRFPSLKQLVSRFFKSKARGPQYQEYADQDLNQEFYPDFVHGIFLLFKSDDLLALNGFDERFFMYMEDVDICRSLKRMNKKILYYPELSIRHEYRRGSSKSMKLFLIHLVSIYRYFNKWGY